MKEDFYIGYLPKMPESMAKVIKTFVVLVFATVSLLGIIFLIGQKPFAKSFFEFGSVKTFEGTIQSQPIPFLLVEKSVKNNGLPTFERIPLVSEGKFGADEMIKGIGGMHVKLKGTKIYRDDLQMIEVVRGSVEKTSQTPQNFTVKTENLGKFTLKGEIVDSKCYLGVMNPGESKPHRDCAVNCLRGGIPALFVVKDSIGNISELWLLSEKGLSTNKQILEYVAEPIEMTGEVKRTGNQLFIYSNPATFKRLP